MCMCMRETERNIECVGGPSNVTSIQVKFRFLVAVTVGMR